MVTKLCECGCGTPVANRFAFNHHRRKSGPNDYLVQDCGYETPCWVWQRCLTPHGYRWLNRGGTQHAHRWYYEKLVGPIPENAHLDHLCRNPKCVNPAHLEPVTCAENLRRGNSTILTIVQVRAIKEEIAKQTRYMKEIAKDYGVCDQTIYDIARGRCWKDV